MPRTAGRSHDDTRRQILDAAAATVRTRGLQATLEEIARTARVSKGGLLYHFATKDELVLAVVDDLLQQFRDAVGAHTDPDDTGPGRLTRAYVRASLDIRDEGAVIEDLRLMTQLQSRPEVAELIRRDAERWTADLGADGLSAATLAVVVAAADGAGVGAVWGKVHQPGELELVCEELIRLTRDGL